MRRAAWIPLLIGVLAAGAAEAAEVSGFTSGQWIGAAHTSDVGTFAYCEAGTLFKSGTSLVITKDRSTSWSLSLVDQRWHLPTGYHYPLQVRFDEGPWLTLDSAAESTSLLRIDLPADGTLLTLIRRGHSVQITSGSFDKRYDLAGSAEAMSKLEDCVRAQLDLEVAEQEQAHAAAQTLLALSTVGVAIYLAPMAPMLVIAALGSPDYHPQVVTSAAPPDVTTSKASENPNNAQVSASTSAALAPGRTEVPLREDMGTYMVPVKINGIVDLDFTVDSGASAVIIPEDVFRVLMRAGTVSAGDFLGQTDFVLADGSTSTQRTIRIKSLQVGATVLTDIVASVAPEGGSLLLGQTFLSRFRSWSMDNGKHVLVLEIAEEP